MPGLQRLHLPSQTLSSGPLDDGADKAGKNGLLLHFLENPKRPHSSWPSHRRRKWAPCGDLFSSHAGEGAEVKKSWGET